MSLTLLLTGFGPFPGAPFNPTGALVEALARKRHPAFLGVRRVAHVFRTAYDDVDRDLPALVAREQPDLLVMFGLAQRTRHVRIEMQARNALTRRLPDATGRRAERLSIAAGGPDILAVRAPALRLLAAARTTKVPIALSRDAGRYLCNYLYWRGLEAARNGGPRLALFVHVPLPARSGVMHARTRGRTLTQGDLVRVGEAIVLAALAAVRTAR